MQLSERGTTWRRVSEELWDVIVIGGGITGAGILREAARRNLRVLLVEQRDFAWGTSSRSSKMVHGGLRYLATGQIGLTLESVRERQQLLADGAGLIDPLGFLIAAHKDDKPGRIAYSAGLAIYDLMALQWSSRYYSPAEFRMLAPHIRDDDLQGGFRYGDAQTDDARLVLRVIQEAVADGGAALNYAPALTLIREEGHVVGVTVRDNLTAQTADARAKVVINATGAWVDTLRAQVGGEKRLRPLRGSHLVFPAWRLPVAQAISFLHPIDHRPVFACPWEGVVLFGTTDIDHGDDLNEEPRIAPDEVAYLMAAAHHQFPQLHLSLHDVIATWAGVRPVVGTGKADPSKESREYVLWQEDGLLTVTGGKLTTFRTVALSALRAAADSLPDLGDLDAKTPVLDAVDVTLPRIENEATRQRLLGRYGAYAADLVAAVADDDEFTPIPGTLTLWAELRWAARSESVVHLDDLLLRRTRLGLLMSCGGLSHIERIRAICAPELGWDEARWSAEIAAYRLLHEDAYALPLPASVPDWIEMLERQRRLQASAVKVAPPRRWWLWAMAAGLVGLWWWRRSAKDRKPAG